MVDIKLENEELIKCILNLVDREIKNNPTYYKELKRKLNKEVSKFECQTNKEVL